MVCFLQGGWFCVLVLVCFVYWFLFVCCRVVDVVHWFLFAYCRVVCVAFHETVCKTYVNCHFISDCSHIKNDSMTFSIIFFHRRFALQ